MLSYLAAGGDNLMEAVSMAAAIEMVHTATLVHDDINDHALLRRGRPSVHARWGRTFAGGTAGMAIGAEYRKEDFQDIYDSLSSAGQIVGSSGNSAFGGRNVKAAFFEALFPLLSNFEVSVAGRRGPAGSSGRCRRP